MLLALWHCCGLAGLFLAWQAGDETIPQTNRPANFSGAAGLYTIQVRAMPTTVRVEEPTTLTVKIVSQKPGPWKYPPQRDKLKLFAASLEQDFFVEPLPEEDRFLAGEKAWEFSWRLLPRSEKVTKIPEPEFVYYRTSEPQDFTIAEGARSLVLIVKPRAPLVVSGPSAARERLEQIAEGDYLLAQDLSGALWWTIVIGGLVLPPVCCAAFYMGWRKAFPQAAERARRRRSRALKTALQQLQRLGRTTSPDKVRAVVLDYLGAHLHLIPGEPTPDEVLAVLKPQGISTDLMEKCVALLTACDTARFVALAPAADDGLALSASQLLEALEGELCAPSR
jgi:hypothetical protein